MKEAERIPQTFKACVRAHEGYEGFLSAACYNFLRRMKNRDLDYVENCLYQRGPIILIST